MQVSQFFYTVVFMLPMKVSHGPHPASELRCDCLVLAEVLRSLGAGCLRERAPCSCGAAYAMLDAHVNRWHRVRMLGATPDSFSSIPSRCVLLYMWSECFHASHTRGLWGLQYLLKGRGGVRVGVGGGACPRSAAYNTLQNWVVLVQVHAASLVMCYIAVSTSMNQKCARCTVR